MPVPEKVRTDARTTSKYIAAKDKMHSGKKVTANFLWQHLHLIWLTGSLYLSLSNCSVAESQIIPDATLPTNTVVIPNGNTSTIEGGTRAGKNLFHSFQQFSIPTGAAAFFNSPLDIQNIFSRVTGGNASNIDGLIRANGTANLFLINPSGLLFGPHAQLNIGGSFVGSTADSIKFSDGGEFSAKNPQTQPLLTVNVPIGLQFGSNPGNIVNQSQANNTGLQVLPGQTLALVGGDLLLTGNITAPQGRIELGSVVNPDFVSLTTPLSLGGTGVALGYRDIPNGNIELSSGAAVKVSGAGAGTIQVRGGQVTLTQGAKLVAETFGNLNGGGVDIQAHQFRLQNGVVSTSTFGSGAGGNLTVRADDVELTGTAPLKTSRQLLAGTFNPLKPSNGLFSLSGGSGAGGNLTIDAGRLVVQNGANVLTTAFARGAGGNITLKSTGLAELTGGSLFFTGATGRGNSGNLAIAAGQLRVLDGTSVSTTPGATSTGRGGSLTATAESIELRGTPARAIVPGGLFTTTLGAGDAGNLTVATGQLIVADGAQISAAATGRGRGGNLTVTADTIDLSGASADGRFLGGLFDSASLVAVPGQQGSAPAGNLTINTRQLSVRNGARISTATGSGGAAGDIRINASASVEVVGFATGIAPSAAPASGATNNGIVPSGIESNTYSAGRAGDLSIRTGQLTVRDGGEIELGSTGSGAAGSINANTDSLFLNRGEIAASSILGQGGNINLQVRNDLILRNGSDISTRAGTASTGGGNGGNITINTSVLAILEKSGINANAFSGAGGNVRITTKGIFVFPDSSITASSTLGVNGVVQIDKPGDDPSRGIAKLPENIPDSTDRIVTGCAADKGNQFVITGRGGLPEDPNQSLQGRAVWQDLRPLAERREDAQTRGRPEEVSFTPSRSHSLSPSSLVEARGWLVNAKGQVELVTNAPQLAPDRWSGVARCLKK